MHLLLVDDNPHMRQMLRRVMEKAGYAVDEANNGLVALQKLQVTTYDLMILDMQMPGLNGLETMEAVSKNWPDMQIIVLTGNPNLENAIAAIKASAVDYFTKPINLFELVAAVSRHAERKTAVKQQQNILTRLNEAVAAIEQAGESNTKEKSIETTPIYNPTATIISRPPVTLELEQRLVTLSDDQKVPIKLSRGETAVFRALLENAGRVLSCQHLAHLAWGYENLTHHEAENIIRPYISRLRLKIEPSPKHPRYVQTVRGRGYQFDITK